MPIRLTRARGLSALTVCAVVTAIGIPTSQARTGSNAPHATARIAAAPVDGTTHGPDLTSHAYFVAVLKRMHLPITQGNLDALYAVEHREGDNNRYNPLNVVQPEPGSRAYNSIGVQHYASFATGVAGTAHLLSNGHWTGVRAALRTGSRSAVIAAFSAAYTWAGGIHFQTDQPMLDAEAVRDVGGEYSDTALAAHRATTQQAGLRTSISRLRTPMAASLESAAAAHRDWATQQASNATATALATTQGRIADALATRAATERQLFLSAITSQYMSGGSAASAGELLDSTSPTEYMTYLTLQRYVTDSQRLVLKRYAAMQKQADDVASIVAAERATVHKTSTAMTADQRSWTAADARATGLRLQLTTLLRLATVNSITQPLAAAELAKLQPTKGSAHAAHRSRARHRGQSR